MGRLQSGQRRLAGRMVPETKAGGFRVRPGELGMAHLGARGTRLIARRGFGACDQKAEGTNFLHAWDTTEIVDGLPEHPTQALRDPGY
jgi:hypothetical protein